jgi:DNA-binding response OmpR family regulator
VNLVLTGALVGLAGFQTDQATTAEEALEHFAANPPDALLTDLELPGMSGLDLIRAVRRRAEWHSMPIIMLTASDSADDAAAARALGCDRVILKPYNAATFPDLIRDALAEAALSPCPVQPEDACLSIEELRKQFLAAGASECRSLLAQFRIGRTLVPIIDFAEIRGKLHRWIGTGATFGFPEITRRSRVLEALLVAGNEQVGEVRDGLVELLEQFTTDPAASVVRTPQRLTPLPEKEQAADRKVILVADDDPMIRSLLKLSLEAAGFECLLADDGMLCCALARNHQPDAIVLDLNMPRMNGFEVLQKLHSMWATRYVPVIVLTASQDRSDVFNGIDKGAAEYLIKPFDINDIIGRLCRLTEELNEVIIR